MEHLKEDQKADGKTKGSSRAGYSRSEGRTLAKKIADIIKWRGVIPKTKTH